MGERSGSVRCDSAGWRSRAILPAFLAVLITALPLLLTSGCGREPAASYRVTIDPRIPAAVDVELTLRGAPRDSLVLQAFAPDDVIRLSGVEVLTSDKKRLPVHMESRVQRVEGRTIGSPRVRVLGPIPSLVTVRYRVSPGLREGDANTGFSGRCHGYTGREFAFATGRQLFLLPASPEEIGPIHIRFDVPTGWSVVAPWAKHGDAWVPGLGGKHRAEHLISAAVGIGRFRERSFTLGGTRFRTAFEASVPEAQARETLGRLEQIARYVHGLFGRELGSEYLTVVLPEAPHGDEIVGEGWASGQGETLVPLTAQRARLFSNALIGAYLRFAPYRSRIEDPAEYWLVDGVAEWYAWKAAAHAGFTSEDAVARDFASAYLKSLSVRDAERNLELLYQTRQDAGLGRELLAPTTLIALDREIRRSNPKAGTLDAVLRRVFRRGRALSFWAALPRNAGTDWPSFRDRYVRSGVVLPVNELLYLPPPQPSPPVPAGPVTRRIAILYTGNTHSYLENCGCKVNQSGGVARRATVVGRVRASDPAALLLDAGSAFVNPDRGTPPDFLTEEEQVFYLRTMASMGYDAAAIGTTELALGLGRFEEVTQRASLPYVSANVGGAERIASRSAIVRRAGLLIGIVGVFEPPVASQIGRRTANALAAIPLEDPVAALRREVPGLRKQADLVIALGRLSPATVRRVVAACPELDVIISTDYQAPYLLLADGKAKLQQDDPQGFLGRTLVLYTNLENYGIQVAHLGLDRSGRIVSADLEDRWLRSDVPDDARVRLSLNRFYDRVGRLEAAQTSVPPLFAANPRRMTAKYAGVQQCRTCHESEYEQWRSTKHAGAYKTLLDVHRHFQPRCVVCHVVGFGTAHGFRLGGPEEQLGNVQCEVCHGPGEEHSRDPESGNIVNATPAEVCLECHTPDHSDSFNYQDALALVRHHP